ncbi:hypothetical protein D3C85_1646260 [compost metagenome]
MAKVRVAVVSSEHMQRFGRLFCQVTPCIRHGCLRRGLCGHVAGIEAFLGFAIVSVLAAQGMAQPGVAGSFLLFAHDCCSFCRS